jgi:hypothetical protein
MKTKFLLFALTVTLILCGTTSCKKEAVLTDATFISEQTRQEMQTKLVGSWQVIEQGVEVAMYDGHICTDPTMAMDKMSYAVQWEKATTTDKRVFKTNGVYDLYFHDKLTCQGSYTVTNHAVLEINGACQNSFEKVVELDATHLTISVGTLYYKFTKLD